MPEDGRQLGAPAPVPHLRPRRLLRRLEEQARHQALPRDAASDHHARSSRARAGAGATSTRWRWSWDEHAFLRVLGGPHGRDRGRRTRALLADGATQARDSAWLDSPRSPTRPRASHSPTPLLGDSCTYVGGTARSVRRSRLRKARSRKRRNAPPGTWLRTRGSWVQNLPGAPEFNGLRQTRPIHYWAGDTPVTRGQEEPGAIRRFLWASRRDRTGQVVQLSARYPDVL